MTSIVNADSLLAIDVGAVSTRAMLFDVVSGRYRYLAGSQSPTTDGPPFFNVSEGVRAAIDKIQSITGRTLVGSDEQLIIPSQADGSGVDLFTATISAGPPLKVLAVGLLEDISLESAKRLAETTYTQIAGTISLNDRLKTEARNQQNCALETRPGYCSRRY